MRYKKATKLPAPEYVDALMNWAQGLLDNEDIFPSEMGACLGPRRLGLAAAADSPMAPQASRSRRRSGTRSGGSSGGSSGCTRTCTATTSTTSARSGSKVRAAEGGLRQNAHAYHIQRI